MTVLENLYMGRERKKGILIDENQMKKEAHDLFGLKSISNLLKE